MMKKYFVDSLELIREQELIDMAESIILPEIAVNGTAAFMALELEDGVYAILKVGSNSS